MIWGVPVLRGETVGRSARFLEAIHGLFRATQRKARGYGRFRTLRRVIFMIAGELDFSHTNPYVAA